MAFAANPQTDPDPSAAVPWPTKNKTADGAGDRATSSAVPTTFLRPPTPTRPRGGGEQSRSRSPAKDVAATKTRLTTWDLIALSVSMAGAQITWSVELGYGTPFLLGLGLSSAATSLVWLAGPISGLIAQPLIGAISDSSTSKYRRRFWISTATIVLVFSLFTLAYCQHLAAVFVDIVAGGVGDWDPKRANQVKNLSIILAIVSLYFLDFALNALQASLRNLLLDIAPADQLNAGNAWHGRMTHAGNIVGFTIGFLPLHKIPIIRWLGGDQFRKFCVLTIIILVATVWITCYTQEEKERPQAFNFSEGKFRDVMNNIRTAILNLPKPIRRVCFVQLFAFMGWFPFLFYSTTYVGQVMAAERGEDPTVDDATRVGEFAMLLYSIVAVVAGTGLPILARRDRRLLRQDKNQDQEIVRLRKVVLEWKAEAARKGTPLTLPYMPFLLRNIWTGALLLFSCIMFSTFFITTVNQAIVAICMVGVCWAVACWVPFAIIMEFLKGMEQPTDLSARLPEDPRIGPSSRRPSHTRVISTPTYLSPRLLAEHRERTPLLRGRSLDDSDAIADDPSSKSPIAGGTVLGIHNLAIVLPQFIVAVVASMIFRIADADADKGGSGHIYLGRTGVAWVLRFGGLCTLVGALIARRVPPTGTEREMRRTLAHMKTLEASSGVP